MLESNKHLDQNSSKKLKVRRVLIIGNPENRRVELFTEACKNRNLDFDVLSWKELLTNPKVLESKLEEVDFVKIESYGEDFEVFKMLLKWGAKEAEHEDSPSISEKVLESFKEEKGRILYSRQCYLGFKSVLNFIKQKAYGKVEFLNSPEAIQMMFDKIGTHKALDNHRVAKTKFLGIVGSYNHLLDLMNDEKCFQVFVKLAHGSSSSGVMAYRKARNREELKTSVELVKENGSIKCFNSLKIRTYKNPQDIKAIIDTLAKEVLIVEKWEPKASIGKEIFDLRIVVIGNEAKHAVMRCSQSPMTNLHLGNRRGDLEALKNRLGFEFWTELQQLALKAVHAIPEANLAGVDVLITSNFNQAKVIEVNAFGDLLPNIYNEAKRTTYEEEVEFILNH
ncbi:STM4014 family protein [Aureibacter tunicatorum]|uniref:Glutathione synthase/RimK-type ligase-like ATP-grasp enzyme n=1 Tax=Aureibacter tunicatorum TaxID=866807 RepID=A0AAE3XQ30_9BACT|nr:STM4014 family protein [Aureibacter tunicatorum]MDR6239866.1 glutathione synthase/RimK-type ligase-like ATP-grasp enzyme [Aureibacter tunicatorum]BDD04341.1 hypothetical protein AUTU_18240 [Aureibacter tunicatorum]